MQQVARYDSILMRVVPHPKNADHVLAEFDAAVRAILRQEAYGKQDC